MKHLNGENMETLKKIIFIFTAAAFAIMPCLSRTAQDYAPGLAVISGIIFAVTWGNPFAATCGKLSSPLLGFSIVLMGFGMNIVEVLKAGADGIIYTLSGILIGLILGIYLGKKLKLERDCAYLISIGTSICGGSAIAAAAPALNARAHHIAIASATVFALNAVALLIFPVVGHYLDFTEEQFGLWAALAIHDTSSVVGATFAYGPTALDVGTTVKLARALWIIPVTLYLSLFVKSTLTGAAAKPDKSECAAKRKIKVRVPWFIPGFLLAALLIYLFPQFSKAGGALKDGSKYLMILTLFIIGANLSRQKLRELGIKPILLGVILWVLLSSLWCILIYSGVVKL